LSGLITGKVSSETIDAPIYFMTEDDVTRGLTQNNVLTGAPFDAVANPCFIESLIATLPTGAGGADELWKLNHYYERLDDWNEEHGIKADPFDGPGAEPVYEMHNLTTDPEERSNRVADAASELSRLKTVLDEQREQKRLVPSLRNP
jgi:hypothetical protein